MSAAYQNSGQAESPSASEAPITLARSSPDRPSTNINQTQPISAEILAFQLLPSRGDNSISSITIRCREFPLTPQNPAAIIVLGSSTLPDGAGHGRSGRTENDRRRAA